MQCDVYFPAEVELETYNSDRAELLQKLDALTESGDSSGETSGGQDTPPKYRDLALIYREYSRRMTEAYTSVGDACDNAVREAEGSGFFRGANIWIDEFTGFTDPELRLINCMLRSGAEVTVSLCTSREQEPVFKAIDRTLDKLKELAIEAKAGFKVESAAELLPPDGQRRRAGTLALLEQYYTKYKAVTVPESEYSAADVAKCIRLVKARDDLAELRAAAGYIRELHDTEGLSYGSIVVAMRNISDYSAYIAPVFTGAGIPFFLDDMHSVAADPLVLTLAALLDLVIYDMAREDIAALLKYGLIIDDRARVDVLDNIMRARNMHGPKAFLNADGDGQTEFRELFGIFKKLETALGRASTISEAVDGFREVISELTLESRTARLAEELAAGPAPEKAEELSRIWNITSDLLDQIKTLLGTEPAEGGPGKNVRLTAAQLKAYIETGFAGLEIGHIPQDRDTVRVIGTGRSRPGGPRALLLLGVNEGVMPANINSGGIVRDSERDIMTDAGIGLADDSLTRAYKELFMVYSVLFAPSEKLYISYALKNADGDQLEPSSAVVKKIEKILPAVTATEYKTDAPDAADNAPVAFSAGGAGFCIDRELAEELFRPDGRMVLSISQVESYNTCPLAYFLDNKLKAAEREECELSTDRLGTIVHNVLDDCGRALSEELSGREDGELEAYTRELVDRHFYKEAAGQYGDLEQYYSARYKLIVDRLKGFCENVVLAIAKQQRAVSARQSAVQKYGPIAFEYSFGMNRSELPAVEVKLYDDDREGSVKLHGRIDRLDAFTDGTRYYVNVIDYKSSDKTISDTDIKNGIRIQLLVYMKAATGSGAARKVIAKLIEDKLEREAPGRAVSESDIEPAAGLYLVYDDAVETVSDKSLNVPGKADPYAMTGIVLSKDLDVAAELNEADKRNMIDPGSRKSWDGDTYRGYSELADNAIRNTALNMLAGRFEALPRMYGGKKRRCTYCPFSAVCGVEPAGKEK
ncbi:MAG: exodeoxyribonuclease V subunit gamma [Clostridia bacterium]|nr:exodeoxyribonuclease V subunit gamma [Clostridia bacterium]